MPGLRSTVNDAALETVADAQRRLKISRGTVNKLIKEGELPSFTIGRSRRIPTWAIDAYIARRLKAEGRS